MKISLSKGEFLAIRQCVIDAQSDGLTSGFNDVFTGNIPEIKVTTEGNVKTLEVDEGLAIDLIQILGKHSKSTGKSVVSFMKATPVTLLTGLNLYKELSAKIRERRAKNE